MKLRLNKIGEATEPETIKAQMDAVVAHFRGIYSKYWGNQQENARAERPVIVSNRLARMGIDKIAIHCREKDLNKEVANQYLNEAPVHFIVKGGWYYTVNINMEWHPEVRYQGLRVLWALNEMTKLGAFETKMATIIRMLAHRCGADNYENAQIVAALIKRHFRIVEWEMAYDFSRAPLMQYLAPEDFNHVMNTDYSKKDYKEFYREDEMGEMELKGKQYSGLKVYRWDLKHGGPVRCDRLEFRFQGKYQKDLSPDLMMLSVVGAHKALIPAMVRILRQVTKPSHFVFQGYWVTPPLRPWWLDDLLVASEWGDARKEEVPRPRRTKGSVK